MRFLGLIGFWLVLISLFSVVFGNMFWLHRSRQQTNRCIAVLNVSIDQLDKSLDREKELHAIIESLK